MLLQTLLRAGILGAMLPAVAPPQAQTGDAAVPATVAGFGLEAVARVDGEPITEAELQQLLGIWAATAGGDRGALGANRAAALEQLIDQRLAQRYLERTGFGASRQEIDVAVRRIERGLQQRGTCLEAKLASAGIDRNTFCSQQGWQIAWQRFLASQLLEENLQRFFDQHRRDFDGTRLRVAQILFLIDPASGEAAWHAAEERAGQLREQIRAGKLEFAEAARQQSQAPSAEAGGELGWIERQRPMPEAFSRAAFELQAGEVSPPVRSPHGLHLILCLEEQPGERTWRDVRKELEAAATRHLFRWAADQQRSASRVDRSEPATPQRP